MLERNVHAVFMLLALLATAPCGARAAGGWAAEVHAGGALNLPTPLLIRQAGHEDLRVDARWETRPFETPLYYLVRLVFRDPRDPLGGWAVDLTHHKLHLANAPAGVQRFAISHGYNLLMLHRFTGRGALRAGVGAGAVIAHPESEVRGARHDEGGGLFGAGYYAAGPSLGASLALLPVRRARNHLVAEARLVLAHARVAVAGGEARVPNASLHLTLGVGRSMTR